MATSITRKNLREGAAADLGLFTEILVDTVNAVDHTARIAQLLTRYPDAYTLMDAFLMGRQTLASGNAFYRILKGWFNDTPDTITLDSGPGSDIANGNAAGIWFLLSPLQWNNCINEALEDLYRIVEVEIALDTSENEYPMDEQEDVDGDDCTYVQSRTQILGLEVKSGTGLVDRTMWPGVRWIESNNQITAHLTFVPAVTGATLVVKVRKPYVWRDSMLGSDLLATNVPYRLGLLAVQVRAIHLIYKEHGKTKMREQFAQALAIAERELGEQKMIWLPAMRPATYELDEDFSPDIPGEMVNWRW